jgi:pimeloyl-ACP methyl ester carboxylesterase
MFLRLCLAFTLSTLTAARSCVNITVPITIASRNAVFSPPIPHPPFDSVNFALNATRAGVNATEQALTGYATVSGTYNISAQFCTPQGRPTIVVQVLTHGIGFDKTYWDVAYNNFNYSYIDTALSNGYSTFSYDRLGIGKSSHGEPLNEIQAFLEVEALAELTRKLRDGSMPGCNSSATKVIHIGHSFGSVQSYALSAKYPTLSDGLVLTGWSTNSSYLNLFTAGNDLVPANLNQPFRFGSTINAPAIQQAINDSLTVSSTIVETYGLTDYFALPEPGTQPLNYPNGYVTNRDVNSLVYLFLLPGYFDPGIAYFGEAGKQPVTIGELLTLGSAPLTTSFSGPVLVFTGSDDLPFCGSNCLLPSDNGAPNIPAAAISAFPSASTFEAYIQPNTGHGLNFHHNATAGYQYINTWLKAQHLGA